MKLIPYLSLLFFMTPIAHALVLPPASVWTKKQTISQAANPILKFSCSFVTHSLTVCIFGGHQNNQQRSGWTDYYPRKWNRYVLLINLSAAQAISCHYLSNKSVECFVWGASYGFNTLLNDKGQSG